MVPASTRAPRLRLVAVDQREKVRPDSDVLGGNAPIEHAAEGVPGGVRLTAEVRAELPVEVGQSIGVEFDDERMHLFDAGTGRSLLAP